LLNKFFGIGHYEVLFYIALVAIVLLLMYPQFFSDGFDKVVAPHIDKLSMDWLHERGLEFTEEEQEVEK